jgi:quinol monooxygenase YgiN
MITITAVLRAQAGREADLRAALLDVADYVARNEPGTVDFFLSQGLDDPALFTTYERFADHAAMDAHNGSPAVARFFALAPDLVAGSALVLQCAEFSARAPADV